MRGRVGALLLAIGLLAVPAPASAAGTATFTSPGSDQQVSGSVPIAITVDGDNRNTFGQGPDHTVTVRLSTSASGGQAAGTTTAQLTCSQDCNQDSNWGGVSFSPGSFAPFGRPAEVCNGAWFLQADVDGAGYRTARRVLISQLPGAPSGLQVDGGEESATLQWNANGEPDLAGYRVYRSTSSGGDGCAPMSPG